MKVRLKSVAQLNRDFELLVMKGIIRPFNDVFDDSMEMLELSIYGINIEYYCKELAGKTFEAARNSELTYQIYSKFGIWYIDHLLVDEVTEDDQEKEI